MEEIKTKEVIIPLNTDLNENSPLERLRINPMVDISEPPVYCRIGGISVITPGNFSMIYGKAKAGKTFLLCPLVASLLSNNSQLGVITGSLPAAKRKILYFDTEQSNFHASRTIKRICNLTTVLNPPNLISYAFRPLPPSDRLAFIEQAISQTNELGVVVIDGVRDIITGINDEREATELTSQFLKWTYDYEIHLILVLHQNKTDQNARGHIGTELINKAETTFLVTKDQKRNIFTVSGEYCRDIPYDNFCFTIENGLPVASELTQENQLKSFNPEEISDQEHLKILNTIFKDTKKLDRTDFETQIKKGFSNKFGNNQCRKFFKHYLQKKWINKERSGKNVFYVYETVSI